MREGPSRKEDNVEITRRGLLKAAAVVGGITAGGAAIGWGLDKAIELNAERGLDSFQRYLLERKKRLQLDKLSTFSPEKKEALIDAEVERVREFILGAEGTRILESGSDDELWQLITMMPPILRDHVRNTKYDVPTPEWPSVTVSRSKSALPVILGPEASKERHLEEYGNAFYTERNTLVTNWHVLANRLPHMSEREADRIDGQYSKYGLDIVHVDMPAMRAPESIPNKTLSITETDSSVHGSMVTISGIDPDRTAAADGTKLYPSMAIRMTPRLAELFISRPKGNPRGDFDRLQYAKSFMVLLPPGETESRDGRESLPVEGMSGSPVLKFGSLAGIFYASVNGRMRHRGLSYNIGFFHGPDQIKKARELNMTYKMPQQQR